MASPDPLEDPLESGDSEREPISPAKRKRLQQSFERANQLMNQGNHDYANELFRVCVMGDPGNLLYVQSFLANLKMKYNNNKKGSKAAFIKGATTRRAVSKAAGQKDWDGVVKFGVEALKLNPWDTSTLTSMAVAVREMGCDETELAFLKTAREANPKDPDVNRTCAKALAVRKRFDEAIVLWHEVERVKPDDQEAVKEIARLAVEKTIDKGGYEETDPSKKRMPATKQAEVATPGQEALAALPPEQRLERQIAKDPKDLPKYSELAELHLNEGRYDKAEQVLTRALEASENDPDVRERLDDVRVRRLRQEVANIDREIEKNDSDEARERRKEVLAKLNTLELDVYENRVKRYTTNLAFKYDLGVRYHTAGRYNEAIAQFQEARNDPRRRGLCMLALGQCFERIKQARLAMKHYETAIEEISDRDGANQKQALYRAGKLAIVLKDVDKAEQHLTALAELDFTYKDVPALLEKVTQLREEE